MMNRPQILLAFLLLCMTAGGGYLAHHALTKGQAPSVIIEWETASEINTVGFHILRANSPEGTFTRITQDLIPASSDPLTESAYSYRDTDVQAGQTYYYLLEDVENNGNSTTHGPIEITAKDDTWLSLSLAAVILFASLAGSVFLYRQRTNRNGATPQTVQHSDR
jgi:hypothetical protein